MKRKQAIHSIEMKSQPATNPRAPTVLTKATFRAAEYLDLSSKDLAKVLGVSTPTLSRMRNGQPIAPEKQKTWECAILLVRMFRSLDSMLGGNNENSRKWFHAHNLYLGGKPSELVKRVDGLVHVVEYLDAMRAKN